MALALRVEPVIFSVTGKWLRLPVTMKYEKSFRPDGIL